MSDDPYRKLATVLDTLPNGFPATDDGLEIKILQKIFTPEEADLFCDLRLTMETPVQIAERTGRPLDGLDETLTRMWKEKGQIQGVELGPSRIFKMLPWMIGIWEMQIHRMDEELAELCQQYYDHFGAAFFSKGPALMRTIPVDQQVTPTQQAMPYDRVAGIIETGASFAVNDCVCRTEERILGHNCDSPLEVCLAIAPIPGLFDKQPWGRAISKDEAYKVIEKAEEAGLVHMTSNVENGHSFICNCCGCCCGVLKGITKLGLDGVVNADFYSEIDAQGCTECGLCGESVCQVDAISEGDDTFVVDRRLCIGCGVCLESCPVEAISLQPKPESERVASPENDDVWMARRGEQRGVDFSTYK
jgi:ferredoxin|tara:strand:+ start:85 stop:1167 length:1083 start_codon:yes stop_codon:yes gene_type:complete